jgi:hypothetical protein
VSFVLLTFGSSSESACWLELCCSCMRLMGFLIRGVNCNAKVGLWSENFIVLFGSKVLWNCVGSAGLTVME